MREPNVDFRGQEVGICGAVVEVDLQKLQGGDVGFEWDGDGRGSGISFWVGDTQRGLSIQA